MATDGVTLSPEELFNLARDAGFDPLEAKNAAAIALVESNGESRAFNPKGPHGGAVGLWQIAGPTKAWLYENVDGFDSEEDLYTPEKNAEAAYIMAHHLNGWSQSLEKADWGDWRTSLANSEKFTMWHPRGDNEETAMAAATRAFHSWAGDDSDVLYPEDVGGFGEPGSEASTTSADTLRSQIEDTYGLDLDETSGFAQNVLNFIAASEGKVVPLLGRIEPSAYRDWHHRINMNDSELASSLGELRDTPFTKGLGVVLSYPEGDGWAKSEARRYGIHLDDNFSEVAEPLGRRRRPRRMTGSTSRQDLAKRFVEIAEGSLHYDV